jgi:hypothetical protein
VERDLQGHVPLPTTTSTPPQQSFQPFPYSHPSFVSGNGQINTTFRNVTFFFFTNFWACSPNSPNFCTRGTNNFGTNLQISRKMWRVNFYTYIWDHTIPEHTSITPPQRVNSEVKKQFHVCKDGPHVIFQETWKRHSITVDVPRGVTFFYPSHNTINDTHTQKYQVNFTSPYLLLVDRHIEVNQDEFKDMFLRFETTNIITNHHVFALHTHQSGPVSRIRKRVYITTRCIVHLYRWYTDGLFNQKNPKIDRSGSLGLGVRVKYDFQLLQRQLFDNIGLSQCL